MMNDADLAGNQPAATHGDPARRSWSRRWVPIGVGVLVCFSILSVIISLNRPTIPDEIEGLLIFPDLESSIADGDVSYDTDPPAGGPHAPASLECGIYTVPVENEDAVAALATGAVWFTYESGTDERTVNSLKDFVEGEFDTFMSPYDDQPHPIIVTAWGAQLYPDDVDDPRIGSFLRDYKNADSAPHMDQECRDGASVE